MIATNTFPVPHSTPVPQSTLGETLARNTFTSLMWALSNPGHIFHLPSPMDGSRSTFASCELIGAALLDLESSFFTPDEGLKTRFLQSGARLLPASAAAYHFYPHLAYFQSQQRVSTLSMIEQANLGTITDPDQSATLILACELGSGKRLRFTGPGIEHVTEIRVDSLPSDFWQLRSEMIRYPLGIDLFLIDGEQVVGIPRTTVIELEI